ncbi:Hermansky-Pudlak syndrome 4 protein isoform X2 [Syngnathus typhle]|uniref:Hermansky-Pudlak syndrome 4 protein isoform X2 n=1 Tax=Syngnathus typhle TaxID=161592 RepID=UPI002A69A764|nr:Hermansky-Pudlak syndrome 4 protein isoform X2 [Syngnathus typhle]
MAEFIPPDSRGCHFFLLYDGSKVKGEGDPTSKGICYFYPEETPIDKQELLCGQLAGVGRCISELSSSRVRLLRLRRHKFAIHMKEDFFWALGCSMETPTVSVCELLDKIINLFCFYNGSVRQSYQVDPLLLLKAALILQACQRCCPLVLAGCILFRGRVVSTQMSPDVTMKIMVHESENFKAQSPKGLSPSNFFGDAVSSTSVFLTMFELQYLQSAPVDRDSWSQFTPMKYTSQCQTLSRTPSDTASSESVPSDPTSTQKGNVSPRLSASDNSDLDTIPTQRATNPIRSRPNEEASHETEEEVLQSSTYDSFHSSGGEGEDLEHNATSHLSGEDGGTCCETVFDSGETEHCNQDSRNCILEGPNRGASGTKTMSVTPDETPLVPMTLYLHRVKGLVLALLVEPHFLCDQGAMEEVYHSCLASLNGLEAHLRSISPVAPGTAGPYIFAHFDCAESTLTSEPTCLGDQGQPPSVLLSEPHHSFTRISVTLKLCRRLLSGTPLPLCTALATLPTRPFSCSTALRQGIQASPTTRTVHSPCPARLGTDCSNTALTYSDVTAQYFIFILSFLSFSKPECHVFAQVPTVFLTTLTRLIRQCFALEIILNICSL